MSRFILPRLPTEWTVAPIGKIADILYGEALRSEERTASGEIPVYGSSGVVGKHDKALHQGPSIVIGRKGTVGAIYYVPGPFCCIDTAFYLNNISPFVDIEYLAYLLSHINLSRMTIVVGVPGISRRDIESVPLPIPPLSEQRPIVSILREADAMRRLRRNADETTRSLFLSIFEKMFGNPSQWKTTLPLGKAVKFVGGGTPDRKTKDYFTGNIPWATSKDVKSRYLDDAQEHISEKAIQDSATNLVPARTILLVVKSKILMHTLPVAITTRSFCFGQDLKGLLCNEGFIPEFIVAALLIQSKLILNRARGVNTEGLTLEILRHIPIPDMAGKQQKFFECIQNFNALMECQEAARKKTNELVQSVFSRAFTGELTAGWRGVQPFIPGTLIKGLLRGSLEKLQIATKQTPKHEGMREALLSAKQQRVLALVETMESYFTAEQLLNSFELGERVSLPDVQQTLQMLAETGLLRRARAAVAPTQDKFLFSPVYRRLFETANELGDGARLSDLLMLEAVNG